MNEYDYFMLKPESQRYFSEIINYIKEEDIEIEKFYIVNDWKSLSKKLYSEEFKKSEDFETSFDSLAYITDYLYGNNAIIVIIKNNNKEFEEFANKVVQIKKKIRNIFKKSDSFFFIGNPLNMPIKKKEEKKNGTIKLEDCNRKYTRSAKGK